MKIAVLWTRLSGYLNSCLKELASRDGVEILAAHQEASPNAPFDNLQFAWMTQRVAWKTSRDLEKRTPELLDFKPDILLFAGWHVPGYRKIATGLAHQCWRVMCMDNCWRETLRQRAAILAAHHFLHPMADAVWVPGERQAVFARKLGFAEDRILRGLYSCDRAVFAAFHRTRIAARRPVPRTFLYVGKFVPEKGIETLLAAYRAYRRLTSAPWPLLCCGAGPLHSRLAASGGVLVQGFVQPEKLPKLLASAGCLILPSSFEPWAVVVHEAASAGLLVLASDKVGAAVHLVQPQHNGFLFASNDAEGLARLMLRVSAMPESQLDQMSRASHILSYQFSPARWADTVLCSYLALQQPYLAGASFKWYETYHANLGLSARRPVQSEPCVCWSHRNNPKEVRQEVRA